MKDLNAEIRTLLEYLNNRPFQKLPGCRRSMYEALDRPALRPLPLERYTYAEWKRVRINVDYHVAVDEHYYSVPYQMFGKELDVRITATTIEGFYKGRRVVSHVRRNLPHRYTTMAAHMPPAHKAYAEWTPERIIRSLDHPQQAFCSCLGLMRLGKIYGEDRLEAACARVLQVNAISYTIVKSVLKTGLDREPMRTAATTILIDHPNIRGAEYYEGERPC